MDVSLRALVHSRDVLVLLTTDKMKVLIKSKFGLDIKELDVYQDQFIVAKTETTLICGELNSFQLSEVGFLKKIKKDQLAWCR